MEPQNFMFLCGFTHKKHMDLMLFSLLSDAVQANIVILTLLILLIHSIPPSHRHIYYLYFRQLWDNRIHDLRDGVVPHTASKLLFQVENNDQPLVSISVCSC